MIPALALCISSQLNYTLLLFVVTFENKMLDHVVTCFYYIISIYFITV